MFTRLSINWVIRILVPVVRWEACCTFIIKCLEVPLPRLLSQYIKDTIYFWFSSSISFTEDHFANSKACNWIRNHDLRSKHHSKKFCRKQLFCLTLKNEDILSYYKFQFCLSGNSYVHHTHHMGSFTVPLATSSIYHLYFRQRSTTLCEHQHIWTH